MIDLDPSLIAALISFITALGALVHSIRNSKKQHELASSVAESNRRLEALKLAKEETDGLHKKLREILKNSQIVKQCLDVFLVENHPAKLDSVEQVKESYKILLNVYASSLGDVPNNIRNLCHGLKNYAEEVVKLSSKAWEFSPAVKLTAELSDDLFVLRLKIDTCQKNIESEIKLLDRSVADKLLIYMEGNSNI